MTTLQKLIIDLDGTLYTFKGSKEGTFSTSDFYRDLQRVIRRYIAKILSLSDDDASRVIRTIDKEYAGEISIGFEQTYGIDRYEYYEQTWGSMRPEQYITAQPGLKKSLEPYTGRAVLLTAAPRVWADKVLTLLGLTDIFGDRIITGEPDIRKPGAEVFEQARTLLDAGYSSITSIGDQEYSDIAPAKALGMNTIIINITQGCADQRANTIVDALSLLEEEQYEIKNNN